MGCLLLLNVADVTAVFISTSHCISAVVFLICYSLRFEISNCSLHWCLIFRHACPLLTHRWHRPVFRMHWLHYQNCPPLTVLFQSLSHADRGPWQLEFHRQVDRQTCFTVPAQNLRSEDIERFACFQTFKKVHLLWATADNIAALQL